MVRVGPIQPPLARGGRLVGHQGSYAAESAAAFGTGEMGWWGVFLLSVIGTNARDLVLR